MILRYFFRTVLLSMALVSCAGEAIEDDLRRPEIQEKDIVGNYREKRETGTAPCEINIRYSNLDSTQLVLQYLPFMWPWPSIPLVLEGDSIYIREYRSSGNIPSPGGATREYVMVMNATGIINMDEEPLNIEWYMDYDKSGFSAESYHGVFVMYLCE